MVLGRRWLSSQCKRLLAVPWATSSEASGETEWRWGLGVQGPADRRSCCLGVQLLMQSGWRRPYCQSSLASASSSQAGQRPAEV